MCVHARGARSLRVGCVRLSQLQKGVEIRLELSEIREVEHLEYQRNVI